jgi:hypothetical protein
MVVVCAAGALLAAVGPQTTQTASAYGPGARNIWTQYYNTYDANCAQTQSVPCGDPNCNTSSSDNCQQWPYGDNADGGFFHGTWLFWMTASNDFHTAVAQAVNDASNEPYYSPSFREVSGGDWNCQNVSLCITVGHLGSSSSGEQLCAVTNDYGNPINYSVITINQDVSWFIGNPGAVAGECSINAIAHHEMGHVLGLGHSSDASALMFWAPNAVNFGSDEQAGLKAIYFDNYQPHSAGGGDTCNNCQAECYKLLAELGAESAADLSSACGPTSLPLPTVTYPTVAPQQLVQKPVGAVDNEVATVEGLKR